MRRTVVSILSGRLSSTSQSLICRFTCSGLMWLVPSSLSAETHHLLPEDDKSPATLHQLKADDSEPGQYLAAPQFPATALVSEDSRSTTGSANSSSTFFLLREESTTSPHHYMNL